MLRKQTQHGVKHNLRGAGVCFGPDVTRKFCTNNNVALVVRSHECVPDGYEYVVVRTERACVWDLRHLTSARPAPQAGPLGHACHGLQC